MGLLNILVYIILLKTFALFTAVDKNINTVEDHSKTNSVTIVSMHEATSQEIIHNTKKEDDHGYFI